MQAIVLAGGFGTRLKPLTLYQPKHMLPIVDKPLLEHELGYLKENGITEVWLSISSDGAFEVIKDYFTKKNLGLKIHFVEEPKRMGGVGAIRYALEKSGINETFVLMLGDNLTELELNDMIIFHKKNSALVTIALKEVKEPSRYGVAVMEGDRIMRFVEKPPKGTEPSKLAASGIYVMEPKIKQMLPREFLDATGMVFPILLEKGATINGYVSQKFWIDVGVPETYLEATKYILRKYGKKNWVEPGVNLGKGTKLEGAVVIQNGTAVGEKCLIKDSIIFKNNNIGNNCRIINAIVDENCTLEDNSKVSGIIERNSKIGG